MAGGKKVGFALQKYTANVNNSVRSDPVLFSLNLFLSLTFHFGDVVHETSNSLNWKWLLENSLAG